MTTTATNRAIHPAAAMLPMMEGDAYEAFREDIRTQGLLHPVALLPDGSVIDGRNRLRACAELNLEPKFVTVNPESPLAYVLSANKHRRHLTSSQLAVLAAEEVPKLRPAAEERIREGGRKGGETAGRGRAKPDSPPEKVREGNRDSRRNETVERAAELFGTNANYVQTAITLKANAPDLAEKVKTGELSIRQAQVVCAERTGKRAEIVANAAFQRANDWVGRVEGIPDYCENVSIEAIRRDERLLRNWKSAIRAAVAALRTLEKKLENQE